MTTRAYAVELGTETSPEALFGSLEEYAKIIGDSSLWKDAVSVSNETADKVIVELSNAHLPSILDAGFLTSSEANFDNIQRFLSMLYVQAAKVAYDAKKPLLDIEIRFRGVSAPAEAKPYKIDFCGCKASEGNANDISKKSEGFKYTAMGGTFDHIHAGHKILLTAAALVTTVDLLCGVTDSALLGNKKHAEILQSLSERIKNVETFLANVKPGLKYEVVPISDAAGPTAHRSEFEALVVSEETKASGGKLNEIRKEKGFPEMKIFCIDVVGSDGVVERDEWDKLKMSSTAIRELLAKRATSKANVNANAKANA